MPDESWFFYLNIILSLFFDFYLKMVTYWVLIIERPYFTGPITNVSYSPQTSTLLQLVDLSFPHLSSVDGITLDFKAIKFPILPTSSHEEIFVPPFLLWKKIFFLPSGTNGSWISSFSASLVPYSFYYFLFFLSLSFASSYQHFNML